MQTKSFINNVSEYITGTTVLHLQKESILNFKFCHPPEELIHKFNYIGSKIFKKISLNYKTNNLLRKIKNIASPNLISGKIKINKEKL